MQQVTKIIQRNIATGEQKGEQKVVAAGNLQDALPQKELMKKDEFLQIFLQEAKQEFDEKDFQNWFEKLEIYSLSFNEVVFSAPSKFIRDWIKREFLGESAEKSVRNIVAKINPNIANIFVIHVEKEEVISSQKISQNSDTNNVVSLSKHENVFAFGTELNEKFTFENFVVGKFNRLAYSMARVAAGFKEEQMSLFGQSIPLYLHGGVGMGKTHLAQAVAWHIKAADEKKRVVYLSAEKFMFHFVQSVRSNNVMSFKEQFRLVDVLIIDDIHFIAGKEGTQAEFMQSFNSLVEENKQVILVCDRAPSDLEAIDEKLKSRISGGMVVNLQTPNYQDRLEILQAKLKMYDFEIEPKIVDYLAQKITSTVRDLDGALRKLLASKIFTNEEITLENTKIILADYIQTSNQSAVNVAKIKKQVAEYFEIKLKDLESNSRAREVARPRQIAMYLAKSLTDETLPAIGREFGGKNHATVIHAVKTISNMMLDDAKLNKDVRLLEERIKS